MALSADADRRGGRSASARLCAMAVVAIAAALVGVPSASSASWRDEGQGESVFAVAGAWCADEYANMGSVWVDLVVTGAVGTVSVTSSSGNGYDEHTRELTNGVYAEYRRFYGLGGSSVHVVVTAEGETKIDEDVEIPPCGPYPPIEWSLEADCVSGGGDPAAGDSVVVRYSISAIGDTTTIVDLLLPDGTMSSIEVDQAHPYRERFTVEYGVPYYVAIHHGGRELGHLFGVGMDDEACPAPEPSTTTTAESTTTTTEPVEEEPQGATTTSTTTVTTEAPSTTTSTAAQVAAAAAELPRTGRRTGSLAVLGATLVVSGALLLSQARRRSSPSEM